jgi:hypothetical protein
LKLDVQGGELDALYGAEQLLQSVDAVLIEASFVELYEGQPLVGDVFDYLRSRRFSCVGVWSITYGRAKECLWGDFLFARDGFEPLNA